MADKEQAIHPPVAGEVRNEVVLAVGGNDVANNDPDVRPQEAGQQNLQPDVAAQVNEVSILPVQYILLYVRLESSLAGFICTFDLFISYSES